MPRRIVLDVDAGVDDALAVILALRSPELQVEAITTVAGNVGVSRCTRNVCLLVQMLDLSVPPRIAQGSGRPLRRPLVTASFVHGRDGLGNVVKQYPRPRRMVVADSADDVILKIARRYPHRVILVATGPLTNLARALLKSKKRFALLKELIIMGGAFDRPGNTNLLAEFNMFVDPEAADLVFNSGLRITLVPLNVTEQVALMRDELVLLRKRQRPFVKFIEKFTTFTMKYHRLTRAFDGLYLHDPLAVAVAIDRSLVRCRRMHVEVETASALSRGLTIAYPHDDLQQKPTIDVAFEVDVKRCLSLFRTRVLR